MILGGWDFEKGKRDPNEPKVIFLLIKTYFLEYLCSERFPAARRCACFTSFYSLYRVFFYFDSSANRSYGRTVQFIDMRSFASCSQRSKVLFDISDTWYFISYEK